MKMDDKSKSSDQYTKKRLAFYQNMIHYGCSCLSFYDAIRIYTISQLKQNDFIYMDYPISYVDQHPELNLYAKIAGYITFSELLVYKTISSILLNDYISNLSFNPHIPFYYILEHLEYKWNFASIARCNHTLNEHDLYHPILISLTCSLSHNSSIPLEWILNHQKKNGKKWDAENYTLHCDFKELDFLSKNHPDVPIDWISITRYNMKITAEDIISHLEYPWDYDNFPNPTISYYLTVKSKLDNMGLSCLFRQMNISDRNTVSDLIEHRIPITKEIYYNPNLTFHDFEALNIISNEIYHFQLHRNKISYPKLQQFYRDLYSKIVMELKF